MAQKIPLRDSWRATSSEKKSLGTCSRVNNIFVSIHCIKISNTYLLIISTILAQTYFQETVSSNIDGHSFDQAVILGNTDFTFIHNGSFLVVDAGREWPLNSKREISFRFKTKSPHGLLLYQTFDHKSVKEQEDQENSELPISFQIDFTNRIIAPSPAISPINPPPSIASLYELYLKIENGRLKITYEFENRLNQTTCGRGLNDDKWHRIDLKVDPELNQMMLILDQSITVEIILSQVLSEDEPTRKNEPSVSGSVLYLGGLDSRAASVRGIKERLYMSPFIGCIGHIMIKTDQSVETVIQPARIARIVKVERGCINRCILEDYCLHNSKCINHYTHANCDCYGTNFEDDYCWNENRTTLSMSGHSGLVFRIYDWRDRHHSSSTRLSMEFRTLAPDSILFFAYSDISSQQNLKHIPLAQLPGTIVQTQANSLQLNTSALSAHRPTTIQPPSFGNYLVMSLSNGSIVVEVNFGDQSIVLSDLLIEKMNHMKSSLSDGRWHNVTFIHHERQLSLFLDNHQVSYAVTTKNYQFYFDPAIYFGAVPHLLLNETKILNRPINLRHKFVGCLRSVYFNQNNILLSLKKSSQTIEYKDPLGKPELDVCSVQEPSSLPITLRSGKSYLTFQLSQKLDSIQSRSDNSPIEFRTTDTKTSLKRNIRIEFEYKTALQSYFLAGGHLRDSSYHDLGGFWTLHSLESCQLHFTISSGSTLDPEQVMKLESSDGGCDPQSWFKITISMESGGKTMNMTQIKVSPSNDLIGRSSTNNQIEKVQNLTSYTFKSSLELLHQVQLGGDLAKFGGSSSVPFFGCLRKIRINGRMHDSREFVTQSVSSTQSIGVNSSIMQPDAQTQPDVISNRIAQGYISLDSCQLTDPCSNGNSCKNNGVCRVNEVGELDCDCSKTGYTGKRCHFSQYKKSCQELFLSGQKRDSDYLIDLDRNGPLRPIRVRCNMNDNFDRIETSLSHNLPNEYSIRRSSTTDLYFSVTYVSFHHMLSNEGFYMHNDSDSSILEDQDRMLRTLIGQSLNCKQSFRYDCRSAPLELGNRTWLVAPYPRNHRVISLDGSNPGRCMCANSEKKCLDPSKFCNCDSSEPIWADDSHELTGSDNVGITKVVLMKRGSKDLSKYSRESLATRPEPQSRFTLGRLRCYGSSIYQNQQEITFKTSDAYIEVPGWRRGDISFSFRTASIAPAIILHQLATSRNHGYFRLTLMSDTRLLFEFIVNRRPRKVFLNSIRKLNNGEWQQVHIEYDSFNLRLTVNVDSVMIDLDSNDYLGTFEGPLFIGGAPARYLIGELSKRNGFTGCFRGLTIAGRAIELRNYLSPLMPTVIGGCKPSCKRNLCQNGGKCIEYWGSYECECSNPLAHSGTNCEINLNTNSITFITPDSYYTQRINDTSSYSPYLLKNILLNIRTYQETALILYASDYMNNFIQLHKNGSNLVLTYNSNTTIVTLQVPIKYESDPVLGQADGQELAASATGLIQQSNDQVLIMQDQFQAIRVGNMSGAGQPVQVKIERQRLRTTLYVNGNSATIDKPILMLTNYSSTPWSNPELELVRRVRPKSVVKSQSQVFLAYVDDLHMTRLPGFTGCVQGLIIDNQLFDFNRAHLIGEFEGDYKIGCKMHCDSFPCKNQGTCIEHWKEDRIICKCDGTSYVGRLCDEDVAVIFNGQSSYFLYNITSDLRSSEARSKTWFNPTDLNSLSAKGIEIGRPVESQIVNRPIEHLEVSLAFSTDSSVRPGRSDSLQALTLVKWFKSSNYFLLALTHSGGIVVQENFGGPKGK